jgi:hypothetical protein
MERQDDATISGGMVLWRRIPPYADNVTWDPDIGVPVASSLNFRDGEHELSLSIAAETTQETVLAGHDGLGLVQLTAQDLRDVLGASFVICRDERPDEPGHILVCG